MEGANGSKYAPVPGHIPGAKLNLSGVEFTAPPFNLDGVQEVMPLLEKGRELKQASDVLRSVAEVLLVSLRRNYPDLTLDDLLRLVDTGNAMPSLMAVCKISGVEFGLPGESMPASP